MVFKKHVWQTVLAGFLAVGLFVLVSGKVWIPSGSARNTQVYIWLLLPALVWVSYKIFRRSCVSVSFFYLPWALFLIWVGISSLWATSADVEGLSLIKRGVYIALYLVALYLLWSRDENLLRKALFFSIFVVALGALVSIVYQYGFLGKTLAYRGFRIDRLGFGDYANYGWPVAAGIFHGAIAVWALGASIEKEASLKRFFFWLLVFGVLSIYLLLTYARGAWVALAIATTISVALHNSRRGWVVLFLAVLCSTALVFLYWDTLVFEVAERGLTGRENIWNYYLDVMPGYWLIGHGLGTPFHYAWANGWAVSPHAHSLYLQQIFDSGLISLLFLFLGVFTLFWKAWQFRDNFWIKLAAPALVFALIAMLTDVERIYTRPGDYWSVFWLPVGIILAVVSSSHPVASRSRSKKGDQTL
ncbi:O-antigen ligase family protein [Pseudomonas guariconensis]|uniref:O-antigen ligase family protein n=1 Tax=Pseudomonas guariconensis TaxID=1288410 RepID=UPI0018A93488|nr:O-antigen ligase family protein [Pseudomonas guariconensis]MBF8723039.1 O-antigen ligase family protein [Pseudomonas guariconensis]